MTHDTNRSSSPESSPELIPDIVLLGEATATLDPEAAQEVDAALGRALAGRTLVVIVHRKATELACDFVAMVRDRPHRRHGNALRGRCARRLAHILHARNARRAMTALNARQGIRSPPSKASLRELSE